MKSIQAIVLAGYGLNCDYESAHALDLAGAGAKRVHINDLISREVRLRDFQIMVFDGGFSWGDDHGAGVIEGVRLKTNIGDDIQRFIEDGNLIIGICNGFQAMVNMGLLPGGGQRTTALIANDCGNFRDQWVNLAMNPHSPCVFTRNMDTAEFPVRHGEGKFHCAPEVLKQLTDNNQIVCRYADKDGKPAQGRFPENPNGSLDDIAGICDPTGRIFGLMPHPEAYHHYTNHPDWTRRKRTDALDPKAPTPGIRIFQNAVNFFQ